MVEAAGGAPGTATFKWSRENASVVQPVVEMVNPTTLRLAAVGRDDVRLEPGRARHRVSSLVRPMIP